MEFELSIEEETGTVVVKGDPDFFFWLMQASGNARSGYEGNVAEHLGAKLELAPTEPAATKPTSAGGRRLVKLEARGIIVDPAERQRLEGELAEVRGQLAQSTARVAELETATPAEAPEPAEPVAAGADDRRTGEEG